ncbi:MAG: tRNA epoxyqueuosine(34) reductase QueG [Bacteroidota bacterium]
MTPIQLSTLIKQHALELGFNACGIAQADYLDTEARRLEEWLNQDRHGSMQWMERNFEKRVDPRQLLPGTKSVISVLSSYFHPDHITQIGQSHTPQIAKYAQGRDYHKVLKKKLGALLDFIQEVTGHVQGRCFVDSAPVLDKAWAVKAGLGWIGKNSNLLNKQLGSYFFLGEVLIDVPLVYDTIETDHCGACTQCLDACPTDAIYEPYRVDASRCISYLTIEHKGEIDQKYHTDIQNWVFGCDVCQDVCPWNKHAQLARFTDFHPREKVVHWMEHSRDHLSDEDFNRLFEGAAVRRATYEGFQRNLDIVHQNLFS